MKMKYLLLAGVLFAPLSSVVASETPAMLLKAKSVTETERVVVAIDANVIIGEMQVSAAKITFDKERMTLKCAGEATIRSNGATIIAQGATIEVGERRVFTLSTSGVITGPASQMDFGFAKKPSQSLAPMAPTDLFAPASEREKIIYAFQSRLQPQEQPLKFSVPARSPIRYYLTSPNDLIAPAYERERIIREFQSRSRTEDQPNPK